MRALLVLPCWLLSWGVLAQVPAAKQGVPGRVQAPVPASPAARQAEQTASDKPVWWSKSFLDGERQGLPMIHEIRPLAMNTIGFTAHLVDVHYDVLTREQREALPGLGEPGPEPVVHSSLGISRKRPQAMVDIEPYRRNSATGQLERIRDYRLEIVEEHGARSGERSATYPDHSKLATGDWYRFSVTKDGVYEITYQFLEDLGVDVSDLSSDAINIYGNHAGLLPFTNSPALPTDLLLNAIRMEDGGDGHFDPTDRILFYASGPQRWETDGELFHHVKNCYTDSASYFVGIGVDPPKRIADATLAGGSATDQISAFTDRQVIDRDVINLIKSGRVMFSDVFDMVTTYNYNFSIPYAQSGELVWLQVDLVGRSLGASSSFTIQSGSTTLNVPIASTSTAAGSDYGKYASNTLLVSPAGSDLPVSVTFNKYDPITSLGYMNYLEINARRDLKMVGDQMMFRDPTTIGAGRIGAFTLDLAGSVQQIWEITDPTDAHAIPYTDNGAQKVFQLAIDSLREFIAIKGTGLLQPIVVGRVAPQDLHATAIPTDLIIVCPPEFQGEAARLAQRRMEEGLVTVMVSPQQVFNEFSSGQRDGTAIKRYMKMLYDKAGPDTTILPRYLLLFGDGSYNNLVRTNSNQNWVPTYQSLNSWNYSYSYTSDDYFVILDDNEGEGVNDPIDMGVGRLPVSDLGQARGVVDKLLNYDKLSLNTAVAGSCTSGGDGGANDWRTSILFCADDQNGENFESHTHMDNSDALATKVETLDPTMNVEKIYLDSYVQISTPGGQRYPEAEVDLRDRVQKGQLLVNYVGHGGEVGWAHERVLDNATIQGWTNFDRLPLFMTATCEFSRWDDPIRTSAGEYVLLNPNGGGIGLMTTTRIAYVTDNQNISLDFYDYAFLETDELGRDQRLGDIYRRTKVAATPAGTSGRPNHRNFSLLGDPSMRLAIPRNEAQITAITDTLGNPVDTIKALGVVRITGTVNGPDGQVLTDFNGTVVPTVFDKRTAVATLVNDPAPGATPFNYTVRKNILYRGRASVVNGEFQFTFVVPKDINYQVGPGRISVYAESMTTNASGYTNDPLVGATDVNAVADASGPEIELYMNDDRFVPGGITTETPLLYAKLFDNSGINTTGSSIGHDLVAVIDANSENAIVLNDWYESDKDTYKSGTVHYRLSQLAEGAHTLDLKAWDVYNNSSMRSTDFVVAPSAELALAHVLNYPNPFTTHTEFYFEHNRPCSTLDCQVQVFTVAGRLVKTLNRRLDCDGFRSEPMAWNGLDDHGDKIGRGVYVYRLSITTPTGEKADKFEKLVILR